MTRVLRMLTDVATSWRAPARLPVCGKPSAAETSMRPSLFITVLLLLPAGMARGDVPLGCPPPVRIVVVQTPAVMPVASLHRVFHDHAGDPAAQR